MLLPVHSDQGGDVFLHRNRVLQVLNLAEALEMMQHAKYLVRYYLNAGKFRTIMQ